MSKIRYWLVITVLMGLQVMTIRGQVTNRIPPLKPKLIVGIVVDPLSLDQLNRYWDVLSEDGFKKLVREGTYYRNASYGSFFTETITGLGTLSTGTYSFAHGMVGESWYTPLSAERVTCTGDKQAEAVGGTFENGQHSPRNLLSSTIGDELKLATRNRSKVFGVSLIPENAILISGHLANAAWWWDDKTGSWMSSTYYLDSLPQWVKDFNAKDLSSIYLGKVWEPMLPLDKYLASNNDTTMTESGIGNRRVFPYDLKRISRLGRRNENRALLKMTPFGNTLTMDFATNLISSEELGKDDYCDYLGVVFSANQYIYKAFGTYAVEMEDAVLRLDQEIGHLLSYIDEEIGKENVIVYVTASRGIPPESISNTGREMPSGRFKPNQAIAVLRSYLNAILGEGDWVYGYFNHQIYLNRTLIENAGLSLPEVQDRVAGFMVQFSGVGHVVAAHELTASGASNDLYRRLQQGFYPKRSGDVIIVLDPGWVEEKGGDPLTGAGYWYDNHVPLFFYGWKIGRNSYYKPVDLSAVAPTLSFFLGIPVPNGSDGELFLDLLDRKDTR